MAFNKEAFRVRALSSVFFVIIMLAGLLWNHWSFLVLFSIIHFGCWVEYQKLIEKIDPQYQGISKIHEYAVMLAGWGFVLWMTNKAFVINGFQLSLFGYWLLVSAIAVAVISELFHKTFNPKLLAHSFFGLLYISLSIGLIIDICESPDGRIIPLILITSIWINDTMAYIVGSFIGKTPFSKISPKKTWEGTAGGAILCVLLIGFGGALIFRKIDYHIFIIAAIAAIFGTLGDLLESKLKRLAGVKDSGEMMPGHGGFLDRFDSLLLATPFVWLYLHFFL